MVAGFPGVWLPFLSFVGKRGPQSTSGVGRPGIPFARDNFQGNSRGVLRRLYMGWGKQVATTFSVQARHCASIHTSVLCGQGASWASIAPKSDSGAVCGGGTWATWILVCGAILNGEQAPAVQVLESPIPRAVVQHS